MIIARNKPVLTYCETCLRGGFEFCFGIRCVLLFPLKNDCIQCFYLITALDDETLSCQKCIFAFPEIQYGTLAARLHEMKQPAKMEWFVPAICCSP